MKKVNLVQRQTGVYQYPAPMVLPPMVTIPQAVNPHIPNRPNTSPMIPNRTPAMNPGKVEKPMAGHMPAAK